jgi:branched-chain amino acid transport system substrate-binding protein
MKRKLGLTIGVVGALAIALTGCSGGGTAKSASSANPASPASGVTATTINLGTISDRGGPSTAIQLPWLHGVEAAVKAANKAGINGRKINLISEDDKSDVTVGVPAYKKLVSQTPVVGILGLNASSVQAAVIPLVAIDKIPVITGQATTKQALQPLDKYFFGLTPTYADQADVMLAYAKKRLGTKKIRIAVVDNGAASGIEVENLFKERAVNGVTYAGTVYTSQTITTADAQVQALIALKPDVIMFHGGSAQANIVLKSQEKFGAKIPMIGIAPSGGPAVFANLPESVGSLFQYVQWVTPAPTKVAGTAAMVKAAKAAGFPDEVTNPDFVSGYVAGLLIREGLTKAGSKLDRESLMEALQSIKSLNTGGLSPAIGFGPNDRAGVQQLVPLSYDYKTKTFKQLGTFAEYAKSITNEYSK